MEPSKKRPVPPIYLDRSSVQHSYFEVLEAIVL